jgi:hypothetical protein
MDQGSGNARTGPLANGIGGLSLLGWRRKRKSQAVVSSDPFEQRWRTLTQQLNFKPNIVHGDQLP